MKVHGGNFNFSSVIQPVKIENDKIDEILETLPQELIDNSTKRNNII